MTHSFARLLLSLAIAAAAIPAAAQEAPWTVSGNLTLASDYRFRGLSQTQKRPVVQGTLDAAHASGLYVGLFASSVSQAAYNNGSGTEIDVYGGYRFAWSEGNTIDAGIVTYWFPGAGYQLPGQHIDYDTQEAKLAVNMGSFNVTGWVGLSEHWFGFAADPSSGRQVATRGTGYLEVNWSPELAPGLVLNLHAGRQHVKRLGDYDFNDVRIGVTKQWKTWSFSLAAMHNDGEADRGGVPLWTFFDANGRGKHVAGSAVVISATQTF
ncbi:TorF family putative porin [Pseudoduganella lutea]|uniref:Uncharacterized protein n=1 Tax=Pseudoduganella lutea TaxID=321985 RepID=A0A4P6KRW3_9BURK|nr:TorF family putative porin [Pseudoduganella lutea]QBE61829.1 hypothetical protein EWM63_01500 [Pseudoduganella lutea]